MAYTRIATATGINAGSGTTLSTSGSLNVAEDDLLVFYNFWSGGTTSCAVAATSGSGNSGTFDGADTTGAFGDGNLVLTGGYVLRGTANATATFQQTLGASRAERALFVVQYRPTTNFAATKGDASAGSGFDSTPSSGAVSQAGSDNVACGAIATFDTSVSGEQIAGSAATEVTSSPLVSGGDALTVVERIVAGSISGSLTASTSLPDWGAVLMTFGVEAISDIPVPEAFDPADDSVGVALTTDLVTTFDIPIQVGTGDYYIVEDTPPTAAPSVNTRNTDAQNTNATSFVIDIPGAGSILADDIAIIAVAKDDNEAPTGTFPPTGWNTGQSDATGTVLWSGWIWRRCDGTTDGTTVTLTETSENWISRGWLIRGADVDTDPEGGTVATASSAAADPPNLNFSWGTDPTLVLFYVGLDGNSSASAYPGGYTNTGTNTTSDATTTNRVGQAYGELASTTAGSDNPGALTNTSTTWKAFTLGIRGAWAHVVAETIDITNAGQVSISGADLTVTPSADTLEGLTQYHIEWDAGIVESVSDSSPVAALSSVTTWSFTTADGAPLAAGRALFFAHNF
jgi:hypothetical protein